VRRVLAFAVLLAVSSTLGGCSIIANRIAVVTVAVRCTSGSVPGGNRDYYRAAIVACTRLIKSNTLSGRSLYLMLVDRGDAYLATHEFALASADFDRAFLIEPFDYLALVGQSQASARLNRRVQAIQAADEAVGVSPT
jgi:hypothetical protein